MRLANVIGVVTGVACALLLSCSEDGGELPSPSSSSSSNAPLLPGACPAVAEGGTPELQIGMGAAVYRPVVEGEQVQLEAGAQGGHHLWVALRTFGLGGQGVQIRMTTEVVGESLPTAEFAYPLSFDITPPRGCQVTGLRYQLDGPSLGYRQLLGKDIVLHVHLRDAQGIEVQQKIRLKIAQSLR
jgi:hypothetical protein